MIRKLLLVGGVLVLAFVWAPSVGAFPYPNINRGVLDGGSLPGTLPPLSVTCQTSDPYSSNCAAGCDPLGCSYDTDVSQGVYTWKPGDCKQVDGINVECAAVWASAVREAPSSLCSPPPAGWGCYRLQVEGVGYAAGTAPTGVFYDSGHITSTNLAYSSTCQMDAVGQGCSNGDGGLHWAPVGSCMTVTGVVTAAEWGSWSARTVHVTCS